MVKTGFSEVCLNEGLEILRGGGFLPSVPAKEVLDNLYASTFALENGESKIVWAGCDMGLIPDVMYNNIAMQVHAAIGIPKENVIVSATHTHSGPNVLEDVFFYESSEAFFGQPYIKELEKRIAESCIKAWESRRPMLMGAATSIIEHCNGNRRYLMSDGKLMWQPSDKKAGDLKRVLKEGPEDKHLQVVWFKSPEGDKESKNTIGDIQFVIVNFTAHPANLYGSPNISSDYPGVVRKMIKDYIGDVPVMFLQGCLGNVHCIDFDNQDWFKNSTDIINKIGRVLGAEAIKQMLTNRTYTMDDIPISFANTRVPLPYRQVPPDEMKKALAFAKNARQGNMKIGNPEEAAAIYRNNLINRRLKKSDHNNVVLNVLHLGDVVFATNPAELFVEFLLEMREKIASKILVACSCTNGHAFYVPTRKAHVFGGYETFVCQLEVDAGEKITAATIELANSLK